MAGRSAEQIQQRRTFTHLHVVFSGVLELPLKMKRAFLFLIFCANCVAPAAQGVADTKLLLVQGVLSRNGLAGTLWTLKPDGSTKFHDEPVLKVTFSTRPGEESRTYAAYEEKFVELSGEVKSVFHGNAVLNKVHTIGIIESSLHNSLSLATAQSNPPTPAPNSASRIAYRHAYYLFLDGSPKGCEACYVPLLISQHSLEEIAKGGETRHCVFIFTYERDSIWEIKGATPVEPGSIEAQPRIIHVTGKSYRYQEISPREVLNLLEKPSGSIPISRPMIVNKDVPGASLGELISDFHARLTAAGANQN
jgi:hypothetical protein